MGLHGLDVLGQHRLLDLRDDPLESQVDALHLDLGGFGVQHGVQLPGTEGGNRLVHRQAHALEQPAVPAVHRVAGHGQGAFTQALGIVIQGGPVDVADVAHALAPRAHAPEVGHLADNVLLYPAALLPAHHAAGLARGDVERERCGRADERLAHPAEQYPPHRVRVGGGAHGGARVGPHPLLVHDDRRRNAFKPVYLRTRQARHEPLDERTVGFVDHPLGLRGDGGENQRALA